MSICKATYTVDKDPKVVIDLHYKVEETKASDRPFGRKQLPVHHYKVHTTVSVGEEPKQVKFVFDFFGSINDYEQGHYMNEKELLFAAYCYFSDALSYVQNEDIDEFQMGMTRLKNV